MVHEVRVHHTIPSSVPMSRCKLPPLTLTVTPDSLSRSTSLSSFCEAARDAVVLPVLNRGHGASVDETI